LTGNQNQYEVAAYYFPQYHPDPRNDEWHGKGWTEWELIKAARPRFPGHKQPKIPEWGYFNEADPNWAAKEIDLAADHGITSFIYDWYWYDGQPFLQDGLEKGFLAAPNTDRLNFSLMWANHNWLNLFPTQPNEKPPLLASGSVSPDDFERLTDYVIENYFSRPNYLKIDGAPFFSIYEIGAFIAGMGGLAQAKAGLESFRAKTKARGFPDLHLNAIVWGFQVLPTEVKVTDPAHVVTELGFASTGSYVWIHYFDLAKAGFPTVEYKQAAEANFQAWQEYSQRFGVPYQPNVSMGWDSTPRTDQSVAFQPGAYPWLSVITGNTPQAFEDALQKAKEFVDLQPGEPKMITLNSWNEWTEGSYLLPDTAHGTVYLEAIQKVFGGQKTFSE
jgi:hypothetical protein